MDVNNNMNNGCVAWRWQWLPEELIEEILQRLPATSLIRFRCVCKSWLSLISNNNQFVRKHLNNFNSVALISRTYHLHGFLDSVFSVSTSLRDEEDQVTELKLPEPIGNNNHHGIRILGHCDGLLLLLIALKSKGIDFNIIAIWNPTTNNYKTLPLPFGFMEYGALGMGLGYDPSIDDYKVFRVSTTTKTAHRCPLKVDVLTLKTNKWRTVEFVLDDDNNIDILDIFSSWGQFVCDNNGGFFCNSYYLDFVLLRFDLAEEKFQVVPTPRPPTPNCTLSLARNVFLGSVGLSATLYLEYIGYNEAWIAKHETGWAWVKLFTMPTTLLQHVYRLLCFTQFGEVLFITKDDNLAIYDPQQNSFKKLAIHGLEKYANLSNRVFPYIHSLVRP